jgi:SPP1 gp7 family putative phage head morphogenesis protein
MDPLLQALLQAGVIDAATAETLSRQVDPEAARAWAEDLLLTATQTGLAGQQERLLTLLAEANYQPTAVQLSAFWTAENERLGSALLPTLRQVASERASIAAVQAGQGNIFALINQEVLTWVDAYYVNADSDPAFLGSMPSLNLTARTRFAQYFTDWQIGELGGRADGLPQLIEALQPIFGATRGEAIAVTETTRIFVQSQRLAEEYNPFTVAFTWNTALDERTCPICGGKHGARRRKDEPTYDGVDIPAHTRCRCNETPETEATLRIPRR